jgi:predicted small secreted protein
MEPVEPAFVTTVQIKPEGAPFMKPSRFAPIAVLACALALAACANTVRGAGKDIKNTANAVEDTVNQ